MTTKELAEKAAQCMLEKQARDIVILDLKGISPIADYFVIATGEVDVHLKAVVDHVDQSLRELDEPVKPIHKEGYTHLNWVLLDYGDIIVHVFNSEMREYYQLEKLWGDAPTEYISDDLITPDTD